MAGWVTAPVTHERLHGQVSDDKILQVQGGAQRGVVVSGKALGDIRALLWL